MRSVKQVRVRLKDHVAWFLLRHLIGFRQWYARDQGRVVTEFLYDLERADIPGESSGIRDKWLKRLRAYRLDL